MALENLPHVVVSLFEAFNKHDKFRLTACFGEPAGVCCYGRLYPLSAIEKWYRDEPWWSAELRAIGVVFANGKLIVGVLAGKRKATPFELLQFDFHFRFAGGLIQLLEILPSQAPPLPYPADTFVKPASAADLEDLA